MRRVDQIIDSVREWTDNSEYSSTAGLSQNLIMEAIADAQDMIQGAVLRASPRCRWFDTQQTYSLTVDDVDYAIPSRCYYVHGIRKVEYSETGDADDYGPPLRKVEIHKLSNTRSSPPHSYAVSAGYIHVSPIPDITRGTLRVTYVRRLPRLDRPRGIITSLVSTSLTLNSEAVFLDSTGISSWVPGYFSVTKRLDGGNVSFSFAGSAYNSGTRVITVSDGPTYETGFSSSDLANNFITFGSYSTCIPDWPEAIQNEIERYLKAYAIWKVFRKDSSQDTSEQGNELSAIEADIIQAATAAEGDYDEVTMESDDW